jgi:hypothetical protein
MYFQIEKLVIWPKSTVFSPRELTFKLGKTNVITGASRTGKTAIIPIIDYCLGSDTCSIPIEIIRDSAAWYGVIVCTKNEKILLARKVPDGKKVSYKFYVQRGAVINIPTVIANENQNLDGIKQILDSFASVPYTKRDENGLAYNDRLSFRDLTHLVFQSQDIVANQNILFYKTHKIEHREKLRNWFPYILGAESFEIILARRELKKLELELTHKKRVFERAKTLSSEWLQDLLGHIQIAQEYGLYSQDIPEEADLQSLLLIAKTIIQNAPDSPQTTPDMLEKTIVEVHQLEKRENQISNSIAYTKKRISDIKRLVENISEFQSCNKKKIERLQLAKWLKENAQDSAICPLCGESTHPNAHNEIEKICAVVSQYEAIAPHTASIPAALERELVLLHEDLESLLMERKALQTRFDIFRENNKSIENYQQRTKNMFLFLGQLTTTVKLVETLSSDDGLESRIKDLENRIAALNKLIASSNTDTRIDRALSEICQVTLRRLQTLDVDDNYKKVPPRFSLPEFGIEVQSSDGIWHLLGEVGSASNWLSFHIAFTCALQEFFCEQKTYFSSVPSFMVYDQPSQVYFPRLSNNVLPQNDNLHYANEDVTAVKNIFKTISDSIISQHGAWQAIILDHAGSDIYGNIPGVEEIEEWRNGKKLIPAEWYEDDLI